MLSEKSIFKAASSKLPQAVVTETIAAANKLEKVMVYAKHHI
jgi:hypothetical protein